MKANRGIGITVRELRNTSSTPKCLSAPSVVILLRLRLPSSVVREKIAAIFSGPKVPSPPKKALGFFLATEISGPNFPFLFFVPLVMPDQGYPRGLSKGLHAGLSICLSVCLSIYLWLATGTFKNSRRFAIAIWALSASKATLNIGILCAWTAYQV